MKLIEFPKHACGLYLEHNTYKDYYESIEEAVGKEAEYWISLEEAEKALETKEIWTLQWYPDTPIGFYRVSASTLETVMSEASKIDKENK